MDTETNEQPRRGRPPRSQEETQRRRRRGNEVGLDARLPIPPEVKADLEAKGLVPRWVNDERNRIARLTTQDDYDPVAGVEPVPVGTDKSGNPIMAHLLAKPRRFIEEDRAEAEAKRQEVEKAMFERPDDATRGGAGKNPNPGTAERYIAPETSYRRGGNQILEG